MSYASEDADEAERIALALREASIEVWFDRAELRGGDAWDQQIRDQIRRCRLFIPLISANTNRRDEGYFRREWALAVDRTRDMAHSKSFLIPVAIDGTSPDTASVPEKFHELQWARVAGGRTPSALVERIAKLLAQENRQDGSDEKAATRTRPASGASRSVPLGAAKWVGAVIAAIALGCLASIGLTRYRSVDSASKAPAAADAANVFAPPPHSIAVLPFINLSDDISQEYFSDGLSEELLNALVHVSELQVAARTSSFLFKGKNLDIGAIARQLNVASILEGSVRRSGHTLRVTAELNNAITGYHVWSQSLDRDMGDVLALQTDIATAVAKALRVALLSGTDGQISLGGTTNADAFDAYLRATKLSDSASDRHAYEAAIAAYSEAIKFDPNFALAYAGRALSHRAHSEDAGFDELPLAKHDADRALELAPDLPEAHLALGGYFVTALDAMNANREYLRAAQLAPGSATVLEYSGGFAVKMGRYEEGIVALRRALELDPLNPSKYLSLASAFQVTRRPKEALTTLARVRALQGDSPDIEVATGYAYYQLGDWDHARQSCESAPEDYWDAWMCLSMVYHKLGRQADAEKMFNKVRQKFGDDGAYGYMMVFAQWGDIDQALHWAETALKQRDIDLLSIRVGTMLDPLRKEPRFKAVERALNFPD